MFGDANTAINQHKVDAYHAVREIFRLLEYDKKHYNTKTWNPLSEIIEPGQTVVIKPNFVLHLNYAGHDIFSSLTHPSIIRAVADYCYIALKGTGSVSIVENPQMDCDFNEIERLMSLRSLTQFYKQTAGLDFKIYDTRRLQCKMALNKGYYPAESFIYNDKADPAGYVTIDLGMDSFLDRLSGIENLYGADYDRKFTVENHTNGVHKYCVSRSILKADTVICIPKMKTHKKVGVTLNIKLLVGINGDKNYLAHYRVGSPNNKGDEYPDQLQNTTKARRKIYRWMYDHLLTKRRPFFDKLFLSIKFIETQVINFLRLVTFRKKKAIAEKIGGGNWYGNDTAWRMSADLSKILLYANSEGIMQEKPQRKVFSIIDGIVAGEGDGPMSPEPKHVGTLVAGKNILAVDTAAVTFMGFDYKKIKMLALLWDNKKYPITRFPVSDTYIYSNDESLAGKRSDTCEKYQFKPHKNWVGHIEIRQ
ncbi:MAG TPA: DUF362 domain-containing protein [bacterium]|nr:DUF362 domain-containing protein [bacterium]HPN42127.1 DUF362 domain-containing protein [bacterium]